MSSSHSFLDSRKRTAVAFACLILAAATWSLAGTENASAAGCSGADKGPRKISSKTAAKLVVCLVNKKRSKHGLPRLRYSRNLASAARGHSKQMQKTNCFDHVCPGEAQLTQRYQRAGYLPCGCTWGLSENIAWGPKGQGSPRGIVKAWMHSPPHRSNMLGNYEHAGAGVRWGSPNHRKAHAGTFTIDFGYKR